LKAQEPDGLEQAQRAQAIDVGRVLGTFEADGHMALRPQVVDLVGLHLLHDPGEVAAVGQVAVVQVQMSLRLRMDVRVEVVDASRVELGGPPLDAVHLVAFFDQQLGKIGAVLAGDAGDQSALRHVRSPR